MSGWPGIPMDKDGSTWFVLRAGLERWLCRRTRPPIDAADVASEVVLRGVVAHGPDPKLPPGRLWCWSCTAARNLIVDLERQSRRRPVSLYADLESGGTSRVERQASAATMRIVEELHRRANATQSAMLQLLRQGEPSNRDMARVLGLSVRAIERNRQQLRHLAERVGQTVMNHSHFNDLPEQTRERR